MSLKTKPTPMKAEQRRLHNPQESNWGSVSLELLVKKFHTIIIFWAVGKIVRLSTLMVGTQQVHE
jgi:hypothetical protein